MVNTEIRMIIFFAAKDGEAVYSQQKQDQSWLWFRSWAPYCQIGYLELPKLVYLFTASFLSFSAGVQLQQPGIQPEGVSGVGERETEAASQFSWTACLFQAYDSFLYFYKSIRSEVWYF